MKARLGDLIEPLKARFFEQPKGAARVNLYSKMKRDSTALPLTRLPQPVIQF